MKVRPTATQEQIDAVLRHGGQAYVRALVAERFTHVDASYYAGFEMNSAKRAIDAAFGAEMVKLVANSLPPFYSRKTTKREALTFIARYIERVNGEAYAREAKLLREFRAEARAEQAHEGRVS